MNGTAVAGGCSAGIPGLLDQGYYCNTQDESRQPATWEDTSHDFWLGGGPGRKRRNATQELEGYGHVGLSRALMLTANAMAELGLLDEKIDDDGDPATPSVKRRDAYVRLMAMSRDYQASVSWTWCPNQWAVDVRALCKRDACFLDLVNLASIRLGWG